MRRIRAAAKPRENREQSIEEGEQREPGRPPHAICNALPDAGCRERRAERDRQVDRAVI
jgi:hypothetical protein